MTTFSESWSWNPLVMRLSYQSIQFCPESLRLCTVRNIATQTDTSLLLRLSNRKRRMSSSSSRYMTHTSFYPRSSPAIPWWRRNNSSCTPEELTAIIIAPRGCYEVPSDPYNEVFPNIVLGDGTTALCVSRLKLLGITHVLNAACGKDRSMNMINTSKGFYRESGIQFLGIEAYDMSSFYLSPYFREAADFIDEAIRSGG